MNNYFAGYYKTKYVSLVKPTIRLLPFNTCIGFSKWLVRSYVLLFLFYFRKYTIIHSYSDRKKVGFEIFVEIFCFLFCKLKTEGFIIYLTVQYVCMQRCREKTTRSISTKFATSILNNAVIDGREGFLKRSAPFLAIQS